VNARPRTLFALAAAAIPFAGRLPSDGSQDREPSVAVGVGLSAVSRIVYDDEPDAPHRLEVVYVRPDRARWRIDRIGGKPLERLVEYRLGERVLQLAPQGLASREIPASERDAVLLRMELRRAVLEWPAGFAWGPERESARGSDGARSREAPVPRVDGSETRIGRLEAQLDDEGLPTRVRALTAADVEQEALAIDAWSASTGPGRRHPLRMRLLVDEREVWSETIESLQEPVRYLDLFFLPPDRRAPRGGTPPGGSPIRSLDLVGITFRLHALEPGTEWDAAQERARAWIDAATEELAGAGIAVDRTPTFEISARGEPLRCVVRLAERRESPPEGWTSLGDRPGLLTLLPDLAALTPAAVEALVRAVPVDARPGTPYVRLSPSGGTLPGVQLALPLDLGEPREHGR
jgi:hypothetical protein